MSRPDLLVLDEPTNGLDPLVQNEFMSILSEATGTGTSVLLSSHILSEVERIADRIVVIRGGVAVADGPTDQLRKGAAQVYRAVFTDDVRDASAFADLAGAVSVESPRPHELHIRWSGAPQPLLAKLAQHDLESLTAPEPDLETAFMSYYRDDDGPEVTVPAPAGRNTR